ncbi:MAG: hypothetical protein Q8J89_00110 [Caulobacter sp.]|nr:hypothetical protein [Caulobacter sp.]
MAKAKGDTSTRDLFDVAQLFPVEAPRELTRAMDFNVGIACAMRQAIRESGLSNDGVAARMTELLGYDDDRRITGAQLYAYTAASRDTHTISLVRFKAFVRATGCIWLWDCVLDGEGLTLLQGEEAYHAQASLAEKQGRELLEQARRLRHAAPITVSRRRR